MKEKAGEVKDEVKEKAKALPSGAAANAAMAGKATLDGARSAGKAVGAAASRAKVPLVAGGGLAAGAVGGLALMRRRSNHRHAGIDFDRVISAARQVGSLGEEVGRMASLAEKAAAGAKK